MNDESKMKDGSEMSLSPDVSGQEGALMEAVAQSPVSWRLQAAALRAAVNGIVITDRHGAIIWVNPAFTELTGYTAEEVLGENPRVLKSGEHQDIFYAKMWETILAGQAWSGDLINRRKNGELYYEEMTITPVRDEEGKISNFIAIKQDVTERKRAEEALQVAYAEMEARVEARTSELRDANRQLERRVTELAILNEIAYAISGALDLDELLELLHRQVSRLMPADSFFIALAESTSPDGKEADVWTVVYLVERGERLPPVRYEVGKGLTGHIIRTRQPILMHNAGDIEAFHRAQGLEVLGDLAKSWLGVPLIMRTQREQDDGRLDKVTGVIAVQNYEQADVYDEEDLALLSTIASQAAVAIDNARLFRRVQEARLEMEMLYNTGRRITSAESLDQIVASVVEGGPVSAVNHAMLFVLEKYLQGEETGDLRPEESERLVCVADWSAGLSQSPGVPLGLRLSVDDLLLGEGPRDHRIKEDMRDDASVSGHAYPQAPVFFADIQSHSAASALPEDTAATVSDDNRFASDASLVTLKESMLHKLFQPPSSNFPTYDAHMVGLLPLWVGEKQLGVLILAGDSPYHVPDREVRLYASLAQQMAITVENRRLVQASRRRATQLEVLYAVQADLSQAADEQSILSTFALAVEDGAWKHRERSGARRRLLLGYMDQPESRRDLADDIDGVSGREGDFESARVVAMWENGEMVTDLGGETALSLPVGEAPSESDVTLIRDGASVYLNISPVRELLYATSDEILLIEDVYTDPRVGDAHLRWFDKFDTRALIVVPLRGPQASARRLQRAPHRPGGWDGVILAQWSEPRKFTANERFILSRLLEPLASVVALRRAYLAQEEARMESERRRRLLSERAVQLRTAAEVSRAASSILDLDELLPSVVELIKARFGLYYVGIFLVDETGQWAVLRAGTGEAGRIMLKQEHKFKLGGASMIGSCIMTGQPRIALDVGEEAVRFDNPLLPDTRSEMALLLTSRGRKIGAMTIQDVRPSAFSEEDIAVLQTMADQLAHAIENARLFAQSQSALAERERFAIQLRTAAEISAQMNTILDPRTLLQDVVPLIQERFALYHVQIYLLETTPGTANLPGSGRASGRVLVSQVEPGAGSAIPLTQEPSLIARAAREADSIVVDDVTLDENFLPTPLLPDTRSEVVVPMVVGGEILGVFDVQHNEAYHFTAEDLDVFNTLASQLASALQNARLFEQEERNLRESEIRLEVSQALAVAQTEDEVLDAIMERAGFYPQACVTILTFDEEAEEHMDVDRPWETCPAATVRRADACLADVIGQELQVSFVSPGACLLPDQFPLLGYASAEEKFVSPNLAHDVRVDQTTREFADRMGGGAVSIAILPITFGGEWLGSLIAFSDVEKYFDEHKLYFYQSLAEQGAVALHAARLRDALRLTQFSVDRGPDSIFWIRPDASLAYVNDTACEVLGYSRAELLSGNAFPRSFFDIVPSLSPDQWAAYQAQPRTHAELTETDGDGRESGDSEASTTLVTHSGDRFSLETEYQTKDGLIPVEVVINYLQYGDQAYHCAFARDITERKRAEEAQDRLTTLVESTTELVAIMDPEERLIYLNKAGREMLGLAPEEDVTTYRLSDFYPEWAKALVSEVGIPTALEEDFWSGESAILAQGYQMPVLQSIMVQRKANGTVDYLSTIIRDISEIKMAEEEREQLLADLEAHASKLQTASEVAQAATSILDPEELFPQVVELVRERFDYYYVGIFEIDETGQWAVLRAGTGEAGQKMLADGHRLAIGGQSMIGASIQMREARVAFDVGIEAVRFDNPVLPDTRSEMALPLQSHDQVLGAMTIQSVRPSDFSAADIIVLQTVADQLANAIYNVTLLRQREQALQELERAYGRYTRDAWRTYLEEMRRVQSYRYRNRRIETEAIPHPEARETLESGKSVVTQVRAASQESGDASTLASEGTDGDRGGLAVPIELRGQTLGVLNLRFAGEEISEDMREVVEDVAGRLGQALENARLLNRTRADAVRDQLLSEVTSEVRQTLDMETVLKTAAQEIRRALDLPEVVIRLGGTSDLGSQEDQ